LYIQYQYPDCTCKERALFQHVDFCRSNTCHTICCNRSCLQCKPCPSLTL
jgi:hypothetical protein